MSDDIKGLIRGDSTKHFETAGHALVTGQLLGMMMKEGWEARPIMDGGNYTNQIVVEHPQVTGTFVLEMLSSKKALEALRDEK